MSAEPNAAPARVITWRGMLRIALKALILFVLLNLLAAACDPVPVLGRLSVANVLAPGRLRLPYGEDPASNNLSLYDLNAMFASHEISGPRNPDEATVIVLGDSSIWGILLDNPDTLTGCLNQQGLQVDGRPARFYNVGYPTMSATKDLMLLQQAMEYDPDLIIWPVTLESLPRAEQLESPIVQHNADRIDALIAAYDLALDTADPRLIRPTPWDRTLIGARRALADWWRLQIATIAWGTTGIDQVYPDYEPRSNDFEADETWHGLNPGDALNADTLALDVLAAGQALAGDVPLLLVNEPIFVADGVNSDLRYNFWYPRWAYDDYRALLAGTADQAGWRYVDLWDAVSPAEFTDSPVHLTPAGTQAMCQRVAEALGG